MTKTKDTLTVHVVLDRSGSMQSIKDDTIGGFNNYVKTLAKEHPEATLSLTIFDDISIDTIVDNVKIGKVEPLTDETYQPRASTPLLDAIGRTVDKLDTTKGKNKALVIITDGQENASREHTNASIKALLEDRTKNHNWLVIYLGANQDSFANARAYGVSVSNTANFAATAAGMKSSFAAASRSTSTYGSTGSAAAAAFTDDERKAAEDKKGKTANVK